MIPCPRFKVKCFRSRDRDEAPIVLSWEMSAVRVVLEEVQSAPLSAFSASAEHSVLTRLPCFIGRSVLRMWEGEVRRKQRGGAGGEFSVATDEGTRAAFSLVKAGDGLSLQRPRLPRSCPWCWSVKRSRETAWRMHRWSMYWRSCHSAVVHLRWLPQGFSYTVTDWIHWLEWGNVLESKDRKTAGKSKE